MQRESESTQDSASACKTEVEQVLSQSTLPTIRFVNVKLEGGVATLTGCVGSYYEKQIAYQAVNQLPCVAEVRDYIDVFHH